MDVEEMPAMLQPLWQSKCASLCAQLALVSDYLDAPEGGESETAACRAAHLLRGTLGMFGFNAAGEAAGQAEDILLAGLTEPTQASAVVAASVRFWAKDLAAR